jgi:SAM-dependent methyltransferase
VADPHRRVHSERHRAESFGGVAERYDRYRPVYPPELIDDLVALGGADVLDVGCGTGKAGRLLAERGLSVLGVEVDPRMAAVATEHGLEVEVSPFETWQPAGRRFDLLICAQAWHWIDPAIGVPKAATVLRPGGTLALFWNSSTTTGEVRAELEGVYRYRAPDLLRPATGGGADEPPYAADLDASGLFEKSFTRAYTWQQTYTTVEWVQLVQTHSDHVTLDAKVRAALVADVADVIDANGGHVVADYRTYTVFAHVPSP